MAGLVHDDPRPALTRLPLRRGPRQPELDLMRSLLGGPRQVFAGPIGRCVKRGWCRPLIVDPPKEIREEPHVLYGLTEAGRELLGVS